MGRLLRVDNSRLKSMATCTSQAAVEYVFGYQGSDEPAPRKCGKDAHLSLAEFFKQRDAAAAMRVFEEQYRDFARQNVPDDDRLSWENISTIMAEYYRTHPIERLPFEPIEGTEEQPVAAMLTDDIEVWGVLDLQGREKQLGARYVVDHKSTGKITSWWTKQFRLGSQMTEYIWLAGQASGEVISGAFINAIEFGKLPGATTRKCYKHKCAYVECRHFHTNFEMLVTSRSSEQIHEWLTDARVLARKFKLLQAACPSPEMIQYLPQEGKFNGGCTFCQFRDFCGGGRKPELLQSMLVYSPWEPWNQTE